MSSASSTQLPIATSEATASLHSFSMGSSDAEKSSITYSVSSSEMTAIYPTGAASAAAQATSPRPDLSSAFPVSYQTASPSMSYSVSPVDTSCVTSTPSSYPTRTANGTGMATPKPSPVMVNFGVSNSAVSYMTAGIFFVLVLIL